MEHFRTLYLIDTVLGLTTMLLLWPQFVLTVKRLHDVGWNSVAALPSFLPLIYAFGIAFNLMLTHSMFPRTGVLMRYMLMAINYYPLALAAVLAFIPGHKSANRYGPNPRAPLGQSVIEVF